jgi:hypothetical protein
VTTKSINPVTRETTAFTRDKGLRPLIATIHLGLLELRPKGLRSSVTLDLGGLYEQGVKARAWREKMERKAARKGARGRK